MIKKSLPIPGGFFYDVKCYNISKLPFDSAQGDLEWKAERSRSLFPIQLEFVFLFDSAKGD